MELVKDTIGAAAIAAMIYITLILGAGWTW